jgi:hypothetical protein
MKRNMTAKYLIIFDTRPGLEVSKLWASAVLPDDTKQHIDQLFVHSEEELKTAVATLASDSNTASYDRVVIATHGPQVHSMFLVLGLWQSILRSKGRVDILACDVRPRDALLKRFLANARTADIQVFYSTNRTGGAGGDWVLEHNNGVSPLVGSGDIEGVYFTTVAAAAIKTSFAEKQSCVLL